MKQIALGDAATSPDNAPLLEQEASFDVGSRRVPYDEHAFAPATQPRRPVDESENEDDEGDAGEVDMEPPEEPAEHLAQPPQPPQPSGYGTRSFELCEMFVPVIMVLVTMDFLCSQMASTAAT